MIQAEQVAQARATSGDIRSISRLDEWFPISIHPPHSDGQADLNTWFGSAAHKIKSSSKGSAATIKLLRRCARPFKIENLLAPAHPFDWRAGLTPEIERCYCEQDHFSSKIKSAP